MCVLVDGLIKSKLTHLMRLSDVDGKYFEGTASLETTP